MKITQHNTLYQLTRLWAFNSYILRDEDGLTVIDTNLPGSAQGIVDAAAQIGGAIKRIVITHAHQDHAASLDGLHALVPDAEVIVSVRSVPLLAGDLSLQPGEPEAKLRGSYITVDAKPTHTVEDGDMIGSLRVIAAPGHTPDHIALLDTRNHTLIAGDAFQTAMGTAVSGKVVPLFPFPGFATWHKPTALTTARKLRDLKPSALAVGHGRILESPGGAMDAAITAAERAFG